MAGVLAAGAAASAASAVFGAASQAGQTSAVGAASSAIGPVAGVLAADPLGWLSVAGLSGHGVAILALTIVVFAVFAWDKVPLASVCLALLVALPLFFSAFPLQVGGEAIDPGRFYAGFGHPALVSICSLMVLGNALVVTGALEPVARRIASLVAEKPKLALAVVLLGVMSVSGFVNDTPVVVLMIPLLLAATARAKVSPAGVLMPMNFAVLIGGMSTAIGTSTNLIVNSIASRLGLEPFGLLSFYGIVAVAAVPALFYLWLVAPRLLASVPHSAADASEDAFDAEMILDADSSFVGKDLREAIDATGGRMRVLDLRGEHGRSRSKLPTMKLRAGDHLLLQDTVPNLKEFEKLLGASLHGMPNEIIPDGQTSEKQAAVIAKADGAGVAAGPMAMATAAAGAAAGTARAAADSPTPAAGTTPDADDDDKGSPRDADAVVAQLVVTPQSPLAGRSARAQRLAERYRLAVVGIRPARPDIIAPFAGNAMLRARGAFAAFGAARAPADAATNGSAEAPGTATGTATGQGTATATATPRIGIADRTLGTGDVLLVQGRIASLQEAQRDGIGLLLDQRLVLPRHHKSKLALATMAIVIVLAATKILPIYVAALGGVLVLLASRALAFGEAGAALSLKVILLVAASFALGDALTLTGGTAWLALQLVAAAGSLEPRWILVLLMVLMGVLTNFVSNNAAAAIGTPLSVELARQLGVAPEPYVLAVLFGCNLCYLTPMGYQTNLLVMNAAGYRFGDFVRVGTPLFLIMAGTLSATLIWRYGL